MFTMYLWRRKRANGVFFFLNLTLRVNGFELFPQNFAHLPNVAIKCATGNIPALTIQYPDPISSGTGSRAVYPKTANSYENKGGSERECSPRWIALGRYRYTEDGDAEKHSPKPLMKTVLRLIPYTTCRFDSPRGGGDGDITGRRICRTRVQLTADIIYADNPIRLMLRAQYAKCHAGLVAIA